MNTRVLVLGIIVLLLLAGGFFALGGQNMFSPKATPTPAAALDELENLVTASGTLLPLRRAELGLRIAGQVAQLTCKPGDTVKRGDVLIRLEAAELEAAVAQAQASVEVANAAFKQLEAGPSKEDIAAAQAGVETARAQLAQVQARAGAEEIAIAKAGLDRAASALRDAQSAYDRVRNDPEVGMLPQSAALQLATQEYQMAEARYRQVLKGASPEQIAVAQAGVDAAQANLDRVTAGARPEELAAAKARVAQAQAGLDQARAALAAASLVAPFDGLIARVNVREGELASPGVPLVVMGDVSRLHLETDDLSETNIARVQGGQPVDVSFEALPGRLFAGRVTEIAPISTAKQGGTNYMVTIDLGDLDPALRWGMTGHVEIKTR